MSAKKIMLVMLLLIHCDAVQAKGIVERPTSFVAEQPNSPVLKKMNAVARKQAIENPLFQQPSDVVKIENPLVQQPNDVVKIAEAPSEIAQVVSKPVVQEGVRLSQNSRDPLSDKFQEPIDVSLVKKSEPLVGAAPEQVVRSSARTTSLDRTKNNAAKKGLDVTNDVAGKQADIVRARSVISKIIDSGVVAKNSLLSQVMLCLKNPQDINAEYATAKGFGVKGSRNTLQSMYGQLGKLKTFKDGKVKVGVLKSISIADFKDQFARLLIKKQLNNNLGIDSVSLQTRFSLRPEVQEQLVKRFTTSLKYKDLFDPNAKISEIEKLQLLADMNDEVMNVICKSVQIDNYGDFAVDGNGNLQLYAADKKGNYPGAAQFKTTYDANGNYTTEMMVPSEGDACTVTTVLDAKGNQTSRSIATSTDEYTVFSRKGWLYGSYKAKYDGSLEQATESYKKENPLSVSDKLVFDTVSDLTSAVAYLRANTLLAMQDAQASMTTENAKKLAMSAGKAGMLAGKQYLIYQFGAVTGIPLISSAALLPLVKLISIIPPLMYEKDPNTGQVIMVPKIVDGQETWVPKVRTFTGYQFTGHSLSDPSMLLVALKAIDLTVGDKGQIFFMQPFGGKALLSGQGGRFFREGTAPANALQRLQGKKPIAQENPNETYIDGIPFALQTILSPLTVMFPKQFGSTILSPRELARMKQTASAQTTLPQRSSSSRLSAPEVSAIVQQPLDFNVASDRLSQDLSHGIADYGVETAPFVAGNIVSEVSATVPDGTVEI